MAAVVTYASYAAIYAILGLFNILKFLCEARKLVQFYWLRSSRSANIFETLVELKIVFLVQGTLACHIYSHSSFLTSCMELFRLPSTFDVVLKDVFKHCLFD